MARDGQHKEYDAKYRVKVVPSALRRFTPPGCVIAVSTDLASWSSVISAKIFGAVATYNGASMGAKNLRAISAAYGRGLPLHHFLRTS
jgi:hypothetical protein